VALSGGLGGAGSTWSAARSYRQDASVAEHRLAPGTLRRVAALGRPYRRLLAGFLGLVVADGLLVVAVPLLLRRLVDDGVLRGDRGTVVAIALAVAGVAVVQAVVVLVQRYLSSRIGEGLVLDLRTAVFAHVQRQPLAFFTRSQTGSLVQRLNGDVVGAQQAFTSVLSGTLSNAVSLVAVLATMLVLSWRVTLLALVVAPLFLLPARRVGRRLAALRREAMGLNADLGQRMTERFNVAGALLVKLYGTADREDAEYAARARAVHDVGVRQAMSSRLFYTSLAALASLATAMVYGVGGLLAVAGSLSVGTLLALAALLGRLYGPITGLSNVQVDVMTALVSFERVFEVLDLAPGVQDPPSPVPLPPGPLAVELDGVSFSYPADGTGTLASLGPPAPGRPPADGPAADRGRAEEVLHGVSLRVEPGQLLALVGPSGAGKTTITALVARLHDVDRGAVRVGGVDVRDVAQAELHRRVGVVPQDAHLFHDTVGANLRYARPEATDEQLWRALEAASAAALVRALPAGLDTVVGDRGHRLSGGEKQRVALARLLLAAPSVVVLDEATAHLDSESEAAVQRALDTALTGRTSIVVAHRLSTVRSADVIAVVDGGRVVERGRHEELLARGGLYAALHRTQFAPQAQADRRDAPLAS
jgi:ATP-binding cassette subfamily B protein